MRFTVVFTGAEHRDLSYGLVFIPCPVWVAGDREVLNLHPEDPHLRRGAVARLVNAEQLEPLLAKGSRHCVVVVHSDGNGSSEDLTTLLEDLKDAHFSVALGGSA